MFKQLKIRFPVRDSLPVKHTIHQLKAPNATANANVEKVLNSFSITILASVKCTVYGIEDCERVVCLFTNVEK